MTELSIWMPPSAMTGPAIAGAACGGRGDSVASGAAPRPGRQRVLLVSSAADPHGEVDRGGRPAPRGIAAVGRSGATVTAPFAS